MATADASLATVRQSMASTETAAAAYSAALTAAAGGASAATVSAAEKIIAAQAQQQEAFAATATAQQAVAVAAATSASETVAATTTATAAQRELTAAYYQTRIAATALFDAQMEQVAASTVRVAGAIPLTSGGYFNVVGGEALYRQQLADLLASQRAASGALMMGPAVDEEAAAIAAASAQETAAVQETVDSFLAQRQALESNIAALEAYAAASTTSMEEAAAATRLAAAANARLAASYGVTAEAATISGTASVTSAERSALAGGESAAIRAGRGLGSGIGGPGRALAFGSTAFITGIVAALAIKGTVTAFEDQQKAIALLQNEMVNNNQTWKTWGASVNETVTSLSKSSQFIKGDLYNGLTQLDLATHSVTKSEADLGIATDLARQKNLPLSTAIRDVVLVSEGHSAILRRQGIVLPQVTTAMDLLKQKEAALSAEGLAATTAAKQHAEALAKQKDAAATGALDMQILAQRVQGADAAFAQTAAGHMAQFRKDLNDLEVSLGTALVPILDTVIARFDKWSSNVDNVRGLTNDFRTALNLLIGAFDGLKYVIDLVDKVTGSFKNTLLLLLDIKLASWAANAVLGIQALRASLLAAAATEAPVAGALGAEQLVIQGVGASALTTTAYVQGLAAELLTLGGLLGIVTGAAVIAGLVTAAAAPGPQMLAPGVANVFEKNGQWYKTVTSARGTIQMPISAAEAAKLQAQARTGPAGPVGTPAGAGLTGPQGPSFQLTLPPAISGMIAKASGTLTTKDDLKAAVAAVGFYQAQLSSATATQRVQLEQAMAPYKYMIAEAKAGSTVPLPTGPKPAGTGGAVTGLVSPETTITQAQQAFLQGTAAGTTPQQQLQAAQQYLATLLQQKTVVDNLSGTAKQDLTIQREMLTITRDILAAKKAIATAEGATRIQGILGIGTPGVPTSTSAGALQFRERTVLMQELERLVGAKTVTGAAGVLGIGTSALESEPIKLLMKQIAGEGFAFSSSTLSSLTKINEALAYAKEKGIKIDPTSTQDIRDRLTQIDNTLKGSGGLPSNYVPVSAASLTAGLGLTGNARVEAEMRISQAAAHHFMRPGGPAYGGVPIVVQGDLHITTTARNMDELARDIRQKMLKNSRRNTAQTRGPNAGRNVALG